MYRPVPSVLPQNSPWGFQVFLYSTAIHRFDQPIRTIPSFILGNLIWLKGDFWIKVQLEPEHVPSSCLVFMLSMVIWCCFTKSHRQHQFLINSECKYSRGGSWAWAKQRCEDWGKKMQNMSFLNLLLSFNLQPRIGSFDLLFLRLWCSFFPL